MTEDKNSKEETTKESRRGNSNSNDDLRNNELEGDDKQKEQFSSYRTEKAQ